MGVNKLMNTFFSALNEQTAPKVGGRVFNTPMGPFAWNDTLQMWVNTNTGMQMSNISFQDMSALMDYDTLGGSSNETSAVASIPTITTLNFSPTTQNFSNALVGYNNILPLFTISGNTVPVALKWDLVTGSLSGAVIGYKKNGGSTIPWNQNTSTGATTFAAGDTLQVLINVESAGAAGATLRLYNVTDSNAICSNTLTINVTEDI